MSTKIEESRLAEVMTRPLESGGHSGGIEYGMCVMEVGELVACQFCGGTNTQVRTSSHWTGMRSEIISATVMHWCEHQPGELQSVLQVKGKTEADAITAWNRRATLSPAELGGVEGPLSYRLSMVSGVSGSLWVIGNFNDKTTAEVCAKHLLELDAKNHPEWSGRQIDVIRTTPRADEAVTVDAVMVGRFKLACRALMGLRGQRPTVYAEDLETMSDVLRVLESVATLPVVNEAMVGRAYSAWANAKIPDPNDTRARLWFAITAALTPPSAKGE